MPHIVDPAEGEFKELEDRTRALREELRLAPDRASRRAARWRLRQARAKAALEVARIRLRNATIPW